MTDQPNAPEARPLAEARLERVIADLDMLINALVTQGARVNLKREPGEIPLSDVLSEIRDRALLKALAEDTVAPDHPSSRIEARPAPRLSSDERAVLRWLARGEDEYCYPFAPIQRGTRLPRAKVRLACRSLTRKGLTRYQRGLWLIDYDTPAGAGYGVTRAGLALYADGALGRQDGSSSVNGRSMSALLKALAEDTGRKT